MSNLSSFALFFSLLALLFALGFTAPTPNTKTLCGGKKHPKAVTLTPPKTLPKQKTTPLTTPHKPKSSIEPSKVTQAASEVSLPPKQKLPPLPTSLQHHNESRNAKLPPKKVPKVVSSKDNDISASSCQPSKAMKPSSPHKVVVPQKPVKLPSKAVKPKSSDSVIPSRKEMNNPDSALYIKANSESAS